MIAPSVDDRDLAARLDRLPSRLRDALARELDVLGRSLRDRLGPRTGLSLTIDNTADIVTATIRTASALLAPTPALPRMRGRGLMGAASKTLPRKRGREAPRQRRGWGLPPRGSLPASMLDAMAPEIRAALETAAQQSVAP